LKYLLLAALPLLAQAQTPVILISIDTLRADRVGPQTPGIEAYAEHGTVFTRAETQVPFTLPSHTTLMTSTYPFQNGVEENAGRVPENLTTLASVLRNHGYRTAAFIGSIFLEKQLGLDRGFDTYDSPFSFEAFSRLSGTMLFAGGPHSPYSVRERRSGPLVIRPAVQWLAAHRNQPAFVFIHLFDVHRPWQLGSYDAEVASVDKLLGGFLQTLKREGWWDRSLVILTADHGEGLGDHGESDHGYFVYESTLHVPLIVHWPQGARALPDRVDQPAGLIDVAPTILDLLKIPAPESFEGRTLLNGSVRAVVSESTYGRDCFGWAALRAIREGPLKYIEAPRPELYNLDKDPGEKNNLIRSNPAEAARLKADLAKYPISPLRATAHPENNEALKSLGYLAPGPQPAAKASPADPKDKLPELLRYEDALARMEEKRYDAAIAIFKSILAGDARNLLARRDLGVALIEKHDYAGAVTQLRQVAAAAGDDYVTRYELGIAQENLHHLPEAITQFETACRLAPAATQCKEALERVRGKP
jgi:arylsulfatase A-like enzyme